MLIQRMLLLPIIDGHPVKRVCFTTEVNNDDKSKNRHIPESLFKGVQNRGAGNPEKGGGVLCKRPEVKYAFIQNHAGEFTIVAMCRVIGASRSGFYFWRKHRQQVSARQQCCALLDQRVAAAFFIQKKRYGSPRLTLDLKDQGYSYNRKTVAASMRRQGLRARAAQKFKATTNSKHSPPVAPNVLRQDFSATSANQKWVSDITCLRTGEGWLYLSVIIDLYSRFVIGWSMAGRMTADLVSQSLKMALGLRRMPKGVIVHSDRGRQYCSAQ